MAEPRLQPTLVSPAFDFGWFVLPGLLATAVAITVGLMLPAPESESVALWIVGVLLVDVTHVYASLYRTYLDPQARGLHRRRLLWAPLLCAWFGFLLHLESPLLFWGVLAYVAIHHFIKQHLGFALLYVRAGGESAGDRRLVTWTVWAGTALPVVYWHANLPTSFAWFVDGDLLRGVPSVVGDVAVWAQLPVLALFCGRRAWLAASGRANWMLVMSTLLPALTWNVGIVFFDDDRVFLLTNVFLHGVPYLALVWVAGGRATVERGLGPLRVWRGTLPVVAAYYGLLVIFAFGEESLWDRLVWHEHPQLFGSAGDAGWGPLATAAVVALLAVPQATHYLLDRWIWRVGPDNPRLAEQLGLDRGPAAWPSP